MEKIEQLAVVALLEDQPDRQLVRGQVGTVVENLSGEMVLVEFSDIEGHTYALEALPISALMRLHHQPQQVAA